MVTFLISGADLKVYHVIHICLSVDTSKRKALAQLWPHSKTLGHIGALQRSNCAVTIYLCELFPHKDHRPHSHINFIRLSPLTELLFFRDHIPTNHPVFTGIIPVNDTGSRHPAQERKNPGFSLRARLRVCGTTVRINIHMYTYIRT